MFVISGCLVGERLLQEVFRKSLAVYVVPFLAEGSELCFPLLRLCVLFAEFSAITRIYLQIYFSKSNSQCLLGAAFKCCYYPPFRGFADSY